MKKLKKLELSALKKETALKLVGGGKGQGDLFPEGVNPPQIDIINDDGTYNMGAVEEAREFFEENGNCEKGATVPYDDDGELRWDLGETGGDVPGNHEIEFLPCEPDESDEEPVSYSDDDDYDYGDSDDFYES